METIITKRIKILSDLLIKNIMVWEKKNSVNKTQYQIIMYLIKHEDEEICQKDLENETHLKKASITGTLDDLERKDIIVRKPSDSDKRRNVITLTERVKKNKNMAIERLYEVEEKLQNDVSEKDMKTFISILDKMIENMKI